MAANKSNSTASPANDDCEEFKSEQNLTGMAEWKQKIKTTSITFTSSTNGPPCREKEDYVKIVPKEQPPPVDVVKNIVKFQSYTYSSQAGAKKPSDNGQGKKDSIDSEKYFSILQSSSGLFFHDFNCVFINIHSAV